MKFEVGDYVYWGYNPRNKPYVECGKVVADDGESRVVPVVYDNPFSNKDNQVLFAERSGLFISREKLIEHLSRS